MNKLRLAVIGVGHLGQIHARLLAQVAGVELVGIVDPSETARAAVAAELKVAAFAEHAPLLNQIDAAIIATPSRLHHAVAFDLLEHGIHVFVEKPVTLNVGDADDLIAEAAARRLVLQVGHVERFNPAFLAAAPHLADPKYIDAVRSGPFTCRSTDIGVVLDLMIHDIDIVLSLVQDELLSVQALGAAVLGPNEDWAQARLTFAGGCVANLFASRVAWQPQRSMQVLSCECAAVIDFAARQAKQMRASPQVLEGQLNVNQLDPTARRHLKDHLFSDYLPLTDVPVAESNPLLEEQREFVAAIRGEAAVRVSGSDGRRALDVAERILAGIAAHRWGGVAAGAVGPRFETRDSVLRGPHWRQRVRHRKAG
ncbi:MAG TPA: Gfo/Idh/MocA family oxidoreductase [Pirellulaceae bacterium]|nr:Gfo/Idh/MocA family oxidoreductase [Pirellulaceae bacterium]